MKANVSMTVATFPMPKNHSNNENRDSIVPINKICNGAGIYRSLCRKKMALGQ
jgi:hypothetical protein